MAHLQASKIGCVRDASETYWAALMLCIVAHLGREIWTWNVRRSSRGLNSSPVFCKSTSDVGSNYAATATADDSVVVSGVLTWGEVG